MTRAVSFFGSTIGRKVVMALSGIVLFGFVLAHMAGNLQVYLGPHALNEYSVQLHEMLHGAGLWIARAVLLAAVGLHIWAAASLTVAERAARPEGYRKVEHRESTYASRTMVWSGPILLLFIVYHLLHLTFGFTPGYAFSDTDVYANVVHGFRNPLVTAFYVVAQLALGLHLYHGAWSWFQSLGLSHPRWNERRRQFAIALTAFITVGNIAIPLSILLRLVGTEVPQ